MAKSATMTKSLGGYFTEWCSRKPELPALVYMEDDNLQFRSYQALYADVLAWDKFFQDRQIGKGERVAFIAPKCLEHFSFFYACWYLGIIAVPVCETLGDLEMGFILRDSDPALAIVEKSLAKKVAANSGNIPIIDLDALPHGDAQAPIELPVVECDLDDVAVIIYTSGSTGMPKGVMLTHKNLWTNAYWNLDVANGIDYHGRVISLLPYWHSYALICEVICPMMISASCVIAKDIRDFRKNLPAYQPIFMLAVPRIVEAIKLGIDRQIESQPPKVKALIDKAVYNASRIFTAGPRLDGGILRMLTHHTFYDPLVFRKFRQAFGGKLSYIICGGAPLDLELQIFFKYMGILALAGYGLTETSPVISANLPECHRLGSSGKVMPWLLPENGGDYTFKDDDGNLGKNLRGELLVKGDCVMKGYWRHADASAKSFEDGWLNTGDVGYCDADGFLFIEGRKGNMIVLGGGEKLHPEHVEDAIRTSPVISEVMVIGEKCKNVYACVNVYDDVRQKNPDAAELKKLVKSEVLKATSRLAAFQKPKDVLILPDFNIDDGTMTASLKVRRFKVKELFKNEIEQFLKDNGEEVATKREVGIASSKVLESLANSTPP
ncbi:MAG: AMP-binding protein [Lentisphaerae bacterium]|jgi:long-chain acyl-CoA synthetase|nr:AMP-binding protein [Lentisphaerota bacterium]